MRKIIVTRSERVDWKRCPKKWYWKWRKGYVPRAMSFGALDLGTWVHAAFATWYEKGLKRAKAPLSHLFVAEVENALYAAREAPEYIIEKAEELGELGSAMMHAYQERYGDDPEVYVLKAEISLEFSMTLAGSRIEVVHALKPDLLYRTPGTRYVWLMEHKTAAQIRTEHLAIDDQARPYGAMAEPALRKLGLLNDDDVFRGITYNFIRKVLPDERPRDEQGRALNKNGKVSARQPATQFLRKPQTMSRAAKRITLDRVRSETILIAGVNLKIRQGKIDPAYLPKTPHHSCPKFCDYFPICTAEEDGIDITDMTRSLYTQVDPYQYYHEDTTTEPTSFEMG